MLKKILFVPPALVFAFITIVLIALLIAAALATQFFAELAD